MYRKYDSSNNLIVERETVHVSDDTGRIAMLEVRTQGNASDDNYTAATLTRYIYSNHLQSANLELDGSAAIISYEEYHPYGTTAYQAADASINAVAKRYRYTGKGSGLYYHGARYYIPWLCRWCASDPLESKYAGWSSYNYGFDNPVKWMDSAGMEPNEEPKASTRFWGGLQLVAGILQFTLGAAAQLEPGGGTIVGVIAMIHGADDISTGWQKIVTGKEEPTLTQQVVSSSAQSLGVNKNNADQIGTYVDLAAGFVAPGSSGGSILKYSLAGGTEVTKINTASKVLQRNNAGVQLTKTIMFMTTEKEKTKSIDNNSLLPSNFTTNENGIEVLNKHVKNSGNQIVIRKLLKTYTDFISKFQDLKGNANLGLTKENHYEGI